MLMKRFFKAIVALAVLMPLLFSCHSGKSIDPSAEFAAYVKAYTGGSISSSSSIRVEFTSEMKQVEDAKLFSFSPSLKGSARWISPSVLEFTPDEGQLDPGKSYKASLNLGAIADVKKSELKKFDFTFRVLPKTMSLSDVILDINTDDPSKASVVSTVVFSEPVDEAAVSKMVSVKGYTPEIKALSTTVYEVTVKDIARKSSSFDVAIDLNGSSKGFKGAGRSVNIPAEGAFDIVSVQLCEGKDPYVDVTFSQPLDKSAEDKGFFTLQNVGRYYTDVVNNRARVYFDTMTDDSIVLGVASQVKSFDGMSLGQDYTKTLSGAAVKPSVKLAFSGNILPDDAALVIPFYAVGLRSVTVRVVKIYEDNVLMFLQDNDLGGSDGLRRSGRLVCKQTIRLDEDPDTDLTKSSLYSIDLSNLFKKEPGAIYRVRFTYTLEQSIYAGAQTASDALVAIESNGLSSEDEQIWDNPYPYYYESYYDWNEYNYNDSDNPQTPSYYMNSSLFPECNLLTSNIGLIAKSVNGDQLWVAVNDIMTTDPMSGVEVTAYNFQLRPVGKAKTDGDGFAAIETTGKPFAIVARKGKSTGYLKVVDGEEKSLSRFDTGGKELSSGLKGFVYGERGVWRPGDTLHVSIIIEDRDKVVPEAHPVTMELYNPQGQFYSKQVNASGLKGLYVFNVPTKSDDPTGVWNAYFKVGGATFHKSLHIETVKANRLKLNLKVNDETLISSKPTVFNLTANWLTGPAASGLQATTEMTLTRRHTAFKGYEGYIFDNPVSEFQNSEYVVFNSKLDANGHCAANVIMPKADGAPGMLTANIVTRVMEAGGDASITTQTMPFAPYSSFVGVKLPSDQQETDTDQTYQVAVVDANGNAVSGHAVEYRIYKLDWSWWWESSSSYLDSYVNGNSATPVSQGAFTSTTNPYRISFRVDYPEWGRYLVYVKDLTGGHASGGIVYLDWPSWRGRSDKQDPSALTMLSFNTDKKTCEAGEEVTVYIPAAQGGRALVSLENGRRVISRAWVKTSAEGDTQYKFKVTPEMAPNVYVHVTLLQEHKRTANDLPIRMYGVQAVMVNNKESHLSPVITVPEVIRPQEQFTVKVKEQSGKPMTYTLAIVDEGLLDLTSFKTPDPWNAMYAREALGVKTWDLYDEVIGAFSGRFSPMFSIGGDENVQIGNKKDNRFNPVVKFFGPFTLAKGEAKHNITLPMYVGSVRVMVVAGQDGAYGNAEKAVPVRTPLMILPTLPRLIGTAEKVTLPVNVFAMENDIKNVTVKVSVEGPISLAGTDAQSLTFASAGDQIARFALATGEGEGTAKVTVTAMSGAHKATETIAIEVRNPNANKLVTESKLVKGTETFSFEPFNSGTAKLQISNFPAVDFDGLFTYVKNYEYACTEQLSSRGMTLVYTRKFLSEEKQKQADEMIFGILHQLYSRQLPDGGFAYWPGSAYANDWASSMAGQFMNEAAAQGYSVNKGVLAAWKKYQKKTAAAYKHSEKYAYYDLNQAYRLYTMAVAGAADEGAMNRLKAVDSMTPQAKWRLASAYAAAGKKNVAKQILASLEIGELSQEAGYYTFGSSDRDKAMMLETAVLIDEMPLAMQLAEQVADCFKDGYYGTQYTAFAALAMNRLSTKVGDSAIDVEVNGQKVKSAKSSVAVDVDPATGSVVVKNASKDAVYATLQMSRPVPYSETIAATSNGINVSVKYTDISGKEINPSKLAQGQDFIATYTVSGSPVEVSNLALRAVIPSGWEIFNERLYGVATEEPCSYKDIRDDRVVWFFDITANGKKKFSVRLQAAYEGEYVLPSVKCEAMYDPMIYAQTASGKTVVAQ